MTQSLEVRALGVGDKREVVFLDEMSGTCLEQWLEDNMDYGWGVFRDNKLIGYCSTGYADDVGKIITSYDGYTHDSLLLSDVFILPEYRHNGYATYLINEALRKRNPNNEELVFLMFMYDALKNFYRNIGFRYIGENVMVRDFRPVSEEIEVVGKFAIQIDNQQMAINEAVLSLKNEGLTDVEVVLTSIHDVEKEDDNWFDDKMYVFWFSAKAMPETYKRIKNSYCYGIKNIEVKEEERRPLYGM